jgi:hypothetical protein
LGVRFSLIGGGGGATASGIGSAVVDELGLVHRARRTLPVAGFTADTPTPSGAVTVRAAIRGISANLDVDRNLLIDREVTVHLAREPVGAWPPAANRHSVAVTQPAAWNDSPHMYEGDPLP